MASEVMKLPLGGWLTPERWAKVAPVLLGEVDGPSGMKAAAAAGGVSVAEVRAWLRRAKSGEWDDSGEPWIQQVIEVAKTLPERVGAHLLEVAWDRAVNGVEETVWYRGEPVGTRRTYDHRLLVRLLEYHVLGFRAPMGDGRGAGPRDGEPNLSNLYQQFLNQAKLKELNTIEGEAMVIHESDCSRT